MKQFTVLSLACLTSCFFSQYALAECISGDCVNGQGTYLTDDGRKYVGQWKNDTQNGLGTFTWPGGDKYVGLWEDGKMNGHGVFSGLAGWKYDGLWKNSKKDGQGTDISTDGSKYVGLWLEGERHGQGTSTYADGEIHTGLWKNGKMHGLGTYNFPSGDKIVGLWKDNIQDGQGTYYTSKGLIKNITFENGKLIQSSFTLPSKAWFPKNIDKSAFLGLYKTSNNETRSELYVLEDNTFCYTFMGGSLNLMVAGSWEQNKQQPNKIQLIETKLDNNIHLAHGYYFNRLDNKISVTINGYNLDDINTPVFALSQDNTPPTTFRPLLPQHNNIGRSTYAIPLFSPAEAKYFYLGSIETSSTDNVSQLQVTQYEIGSNDTFQIAYDTKKSRFPKTFDAQLTAAGLLINDTPTDSKTNLFPAMVTAVKDQCINPVKQEESDETIKWATLTASNRFYLDESIISQTPHFSKDDGDEARRANGIHELIEDEKKLLAFHYEKAKKDPAAFNELLFVAKELLQREDRKNIYMTDINMKLPQLLVNALQHGDIKSAKEQFNAYNKQIHPLVKDSTNRQAQYAILVVASQGAVIYGATRDEAILTTLHDALLSVDFDIKTTKNATLVYNLACIYSLSKNKPEMLKAITAARKMNKKSELFLKDGDFAFYINDSDFLSAIQ
ncbi:MORN repeat-containing protein [Psychromonas sp. Urea-02u-13]|uniref:MORN repeat-containing protein n=1 Tax=Psychromonas sp. Urea-02u-13 TaxID=2058326 RepID=UPI000C33B694|nr:hypothetical protein [Psychromonas sp. Urea-02u-13]PKG38858.1 hypothetical protein CXF74_11245 [Psychromonas sp. Urea-02u-13]